MTPTLKSITLPTHVTLPYVEQGDPAGLPILLLHGVTDSWRSFALLLPYLPASLHVFALSQRGHGDADHPPTGYGFSDFAADVAAFIDTLQLGRALIVGHSMGSTVAQRVALDYPDHVLGLVLLGAFADLRTNPSVAALWNAAISQLVDPIDPHFVRDFQRSTLAQLVPAAFFETAVHESLKVSACVWKATFDTFLHEGGTGELGGISAPTLIVWGDRDSFCPRSDQETLAATIPDAQLLVYAGAGHALHWEEPARVAFDVTRFATQRVHGGGNPDRHR